MGLELYGRIEEMFLDKNVAEYLWNVYVEILKKLDIKNVLDIGCGSGEFCKRAKENGFDIKGVDLSATQVRRAQKICDCALQNICDVSEKFEAAVAIFDVINYMNQTQLIDFFKCVENVVDKYFIFDINSFFAMSELAIGVLKAEDENRFAVLCSDSENDILKTQITLLEKQNECYKKSQADILQYYHSIEKICTYTNMKLIDKIPISLYDSGEIEKWILVFKK